MKFVPIVLAGLFASSLASVDAQTQRVSLDRTGGRVFVVDATGAGDFLQPQPAVDAAQDGDTILIKPFTPAYDAFTVDNKALRIAADGELTTTGRIRIENLAAGKGLYLFRVRSDIQLQFNDGHVVVEDSGGVFKDCWVDECEQVTFVGCIFYGEWGFLDCQGMDGLSALYAYDSTIVLHDTQLYGGNGGEHFCLTGSPGDGGAGLTLRNSTALVADSVLLGGLGGTGSTGTGNPGPPFALEGVSTLDETVHASNHLISPHLVRASEEYVLRVVGPPGERAWINFGSELDLNILSPSIGALALEPPLTPFPVGRIPASGVLTVPLAAPTLAAQDSSILWLQAYVSNGSQRILTNPSAIVVVDEQF